MAFNTTGTSLGLEQLHHSALQMNIVVLVCCFFFNKNSASVSKA